MLINNNNKIDQAIILCGGFATRLKNKTKDKVPKSLIRINNIPFILYLIDQIINLGITKIIFCTGFLGEQIEKQVMFFNKSNNLNLELFFSREKIPLGTAGSIINAKKFILGKDTLVLNGDTYFNGPLLNLINFHNLNKGHISMTANLKFVSSRYGKLITNNNKLINIKEKSFFIYSYVYSGIFLMNNNILKDYNDLSFMNVENSFFKNKNYQINVWKNNSSFIDIGTEYSLKKSSRFMSKIKLKYIVN